jgi:hypothetical protein
LPFFFVVVKPGLLQQGMEHLCLETSPGALRVSESRTMDTTDRSKLHDKQCKVDLSQNVSWMSNQEGSDERDSREVDVTFSADVL